MGKKVFVSYKYADNKVKNINENYSWYTCKVRDYVTKLEELLKDKTDHIYKGESDGEDLSQLSEDTIWDKLKNRIYDSTLTIVMLSKGMRVSYIEEKNQWIPREISYSLKEISRIDKQGNKVTSRTNALMAIILPDEYDSYEYFTSKKDCCSSGCTTYYKNSGLIFTIMSENMFNQKKPDTNTCENNDTVYHGECHYMLCVRWDDFIKDVDKYIDRAYEIQDNQDEYTIRKEV